jgi:hypothetical protein
MLDNSNTTKTYSALKKKNWWNRRLLRGATISNEALLKGFQFLSTNRLYKFKIFLFFF